MAVERKWEETDVLKNHDGTFSWVIEFYVVKSGETTVSEVRSRLRFQTAAEARADAQRYIAERPLVAELS